MASLLDIISASIIGGMVLILSLTVTDSGVRQFYNYNADAIVQTNLTQMAYLIEYDLRKIGFGIDELAQGSILQIAQSNHVKFLSQLNFNTDMIADTIEYKILQAESIDFGDTTIVIYDVWRSIHIVNQSHQNMSIGRIGNPNVFRFLDQVGNVAPIILAIKMVEVMLVTYDPHIILSAEYLKDKLANEEMTEFRKQELRRLLRPTFWRQTRLVSRNLRR